MIGRHEGKLSACVSLSLGHNILYNSIEGFAIVLKDADKKSLLHDRICKK